jgi:hypothetical protein
VSWRDVRIFDRPDPHALEPDDWMSDRLEHLSHLPLTPFVNRELDGRLIPGARVRRVDETRLGWRGAAPLDRHAFFEALDRMIVRHPADARVVDLVDFVPRMRQAVRQLAIVGEQQQPFRVVVEAPDRIDVFLHAAQQVEHRRTLLRIVA